MKINKKLLGFGTLALPIVVAASMFFAMNPNTNLLNRAIAGDDTIDGTIVFSTSTGSRTSPSSGTYVTDGSLTQGMKLYSYVTDSGTCSGSVIANMSGSRGTRMVFTSSSTSTNLFKFQNLSSISVTSNYNDQCTFLINTSTNGISYTEKVKTTLNGSFTDFSISGAKYVYLEAYAGSRSSTTLIGVTNVTLKYSCSPSYEGETLESIETNGEVKTSYNVGGTFVKPEILANYSDGTQSIVTNQATFTGYDLSTPGVQTVTVSYTEKGVTETTTYEITVSEATARLSAGKYTTTGISASFTLNSDGTGSFISSYDYNQATFNWSEDGDVVLFTNIALGEGYTNTNYAALHRDPDTGSTITTHSGSINGTNSFTIRLRKGSSSTSYTFTK